MESREPSLVPLEWRGDAVNDASGTGVVTDTVRIAFLANDLFFELAR